MKTLIIIAVLAASAHAGCANGTCSLRLQLRPNIQRTVQRTRTVTAAYDPVAVAVAEPVCGGVQACNVGTTKTVTRTRLRRLFRCRR